MLDVQQTVLALLAGNVLAFPLRALRHQLPHYMGIYAPRTGLQILAARSGAAGREPGGGGGGFLLGIWMVMPGWKIGQGSGFRVQKGGIQDPDRGSSIMNRVFRHG